MCARVNPFQQYSLRLWWPCFFFVCVSSIEVGIFVRLSTNVSYSEKKLGLMFYLFQNQPPKPVCTEKTEDSPQTELLCS